MTGGIHESSCTMISLLLKDAILDVQFSFQMDLNQLCTSITAVLCPSFAWPLFSQMSVALYNFFLIEFAVAIGH